MSDLRTLGFLLAAFCCVGGTAFAKTPESHYFVIQVTDDQTHRGVPLVELRTVHQSRYYTDSNGIVALDEPGLEGQNVFFFVSSPGYEFPADGFGYRGKALKVKRGETVKLSIHRLNLAERLYRVTGEGIYRDSVLAGLSVPPTQSLLNRNVMGQDTVDNAIYGGRLFWIWGDTSRPGYPLGNFHTTGATSTLPGKGGPDTSVGVDLKYFAGKDGFVSGITPFNEHGPTWIDGLVTLNEGGRERLYCTYANVRQDMSSTGWGLAVWDDGKSQFVKDAEYPLTGAIHPHGHVFKATANGVPYLYFCTPYPLFRVRANHEDLRDSSHFEAFTCLKAGSRFDPVHPEAAQIERDAAGQLAYGWKRNTSPVGPDEQDKLVRAGLLKAEEGLLQLRDPDTGEAVYAHGGSVYWNAYRKKWVMIAAQRGGHSNLGEIWYAEAETPVGPWVYARKVLTHNHYSFYNPKQHPYFDEGGGQRIYFEGTYTTTFSGSEETATPRYDYNQIMCRLDLTDPRMVLPGPVATPPWLTTKAKSDQNADFFAADRLAPGLVPVYWRKSAGDSGRLVVETSEVKGENALFYAIPGSEPHPPKTCLPLYESTRSSDGSRTYVTDPKDLPFGFVVSDRPICLVWKNPCPVSLREFRAVAEPWMVATKEKK